MSALLFKTRATPEGVDTEWDVDALRDAQDVELHAVRSVIDAELERRDDDPTIERCGEMIETYGAPMPCRKPKGHPDPEHMATYRAAL